MTPRAGMETAISQVESAIGVRVLPRMRARPFSAAFAVFAVLLGAYLGSTFLVGASRPLLRPDGPFGLDLVFRMNLVLAVIVAYSVAVGLLEFRTVPEELGRLRELLDCDDDSFHAAVLESFPNRLQMAAGSTLGGLFGVVISAVVYAEIARAGSSFSWDLHEAWKDALTVLLFALLGLLALWAVRSAGLYSSLARRYLRVELLDPQPLQLFAARGLRLALFWFVGSGIALLLVVQNQTPDVILGVIGVTFAVGVASLVLPSVGIHQRMQAAKALELARVREEIATRLAALRDGDTASAAALPALLAWETRVAEVREWPLGGAVLVRFTLLVLIPLGSWLGGALVERLVNGVLD